jgi:hypothetical protein
MRVMRPSRSAWTWITREPEFAGSPPHPVPGGYRSW